LTLQQRTKVVTTEKVLEHIEQQIGEKGLTFSTVNLENQFLIDSNILITMDGVILGFSATGSPMQWFEVAGKSRDDLKAFDIPWEIDNQGKLVVAGSEEKCTLSKLAENNLIDVSVICGNKEKGKEEKSLKLLASLIKPKPLPSNDFTGKSFKVSEETTITFRNDGTFNCNDKEICSYEDHPSYKNTVMFIDDSEKTKEHTLVLLVEGSIAKGKLLFISFKGDKSIFNEVELYQIADGALKNLFNTKNQDTKKGEDKDANNDKKDSKENKENKEKSDNNSDSNDNPNAGTENPTYIPFTQDMVSGNTFYSVGNEDDDKGITIFFGANKKGQVWFSLSDSNTSPDVTFDYLIDNEGYIIFSNTKEKGVVSDDTPAIGLLSETNNALTTCWGSSSVSDISDYCKDDDINIWHKTKEDAETALKQREDNDTDENTNDNSDSNDNPNSGTQNTNYSPFTQEMVSGKTLYNVYIDWDDQDKDGSTTDWVASTFTFDNSGEGKGVFGIHDSITKADASFNFSINDKGYLILSNVTFTNPEDDPDDGHSTDAIGLIEDAGESFKVCWRGSPEQLNNGNGCDGNERFYKIKADAEAALEAPEIVYSDDYSDREDNPYAIQNPNYSPFSEKIVAGKTFYVSGVEKDDNLTISFDANKKGKVWLSLAENTTPPDMIFDYLIDTEGYVVFFNVKENGVDSEYSPAMGLLVENNHALIVCWSNYSLSDIRDVCKNDDKMIMYKTKDAAQAEIRADDEYFDDHSDYVDNPDPGTKNPDYIRFTQEMISGKTLYSLSTPKNYDEQYAKVTVQFDNSKTGKYQFGFHENVSSPYGTFDYRINDQGYIIFSNLVVDGGALIGLESTHGLFFRDTTFLELCVATSKESLERNECAVEVWFYSKEDAEGSI
jgi:hypothetical protein